MDSFEIEGVWWLPYKEDEKLNGVLSFSPSEGGKLKLFGSFQNESKKISSHNILKNRDIILGSVNRRKITCYNCLHVRQNSTASFIVQSIFDGYHFLEEEAISFNSISVNFSHLEDWILNFFDKYEERHNPTSEGETIVTLNFLSKKSEMKLYESSELILSLMSNLSYTREINSLLLSENTYFHIVSKDNMHFNDWENGILFDLRNFLSLALDIPVFPVSINGKRKDNKIIHPFSKEEIFPNIKIFYKTNMSIEEVNPSNVLFRYDNLKDNPNFYFNNWFRISKSLNPMINLYIGNLYNTQTFLEFQFLSLAQAIEFYHRKMYEGNYLESEEFHEIYFVLSETIRQNLKNDIANTFITKLVYLNQYALKRRIKDILKFLHKKGLLEWDKKERELFVTKVGNYRDYLTHYEHSENSNVDYSELWSYVEKMKIVLKACLRYEIFNCGVKPS